MFFEKIDFNNKEIEKKFFLPENIHEATWRNYSNNYHYALYKIIQKGLPLNYAFNRRSRPILFLFRHCIELSLKRSLAGFNLIIPTKHSFSDLIDAFDKKYLILMSISEIIEPIDFDKDGSCLRYPSTAFVYDSIDDKSRIKFGEVLKKYNQLFWTLPSNFKLGDLSPRFNYDNNKHAWDFTFHMLEGGKIGQIRTQYNQTISFILEGIQNDDWDIKQLYLPLIFLIRHSLELGLKFNIQEIQKSGSSLANTKDYSHEHSLSSLYNGFNAFLKKIDGSKLTPSVKSEIDAYQSKFYSLNEIVHNLDANSRYFRYPVDKSGRPHGLKLKKRTLINIMKLYYVTDPFITFTTAVLDEEGINF